MRFNVLVLLILYACFPNVAVADESFECTVEGDVRFRDPREAREALVEVAPDPLWGNRSSSAFEEWKKTVGNLPNVSCTASAKPKADGSFSLKFMIEAKNGAFPRLRIRQKGSSESRECMCAHVVIKASASGQRGVTRRVMVSESEPREIGTLMFTGGGRVKGRLVESGTFKPIAGVEIEIHEPTLGFFRGFAANAVRSGDDGKFVFEADFTPDYSFELRLPDVTKTLARDSGWGQFTRGKGDVDVGDLFVVKPGSLAIKVSDPDSDSVGRFAWALHFAGRGGHPAEFSGYSDTDQLEIKGIPPGHVELSLDAGGLHNEILTGLSIEEGKLLTLPDRAFIRKRSLRTGAAFSAGGKPKRWNVRLELLNGQVPSGFSSRKDSQVRPVFTAGSECSTENPSVGDLFDGTWYVEVSCLGFAPYFAEIALPQTKPLEATLGVSGHLEVSLDVTQGGSCSVYAIGCATPAYRQVSSLKGKAMAEALVALPHRCGVARCALDGSTLARFSDLAPGSYMIVMQLADSVSFVDKIEVKAGQTAVASIKPDLPRVRVRVTRKGAPVVGEKVYGRSIYTRSSGELSAVTGTDGYASFQDLQPDTLVFFTTRERNWVNKDESALRAALALEREISLSYGSDKDHAIEMEDSWLVWLVLDPDLPPGKAIDDLTVQFMADFAKQQSTIPALTNGAGRYECGYVAPGEYVAQFTVKSVGEEGGVRVKRIFKVPAGGDRTVALKVRLHKLEGTAKIPKGYDAFGGAYQVSLRELGEDTSKPYGGFSSNSIAKKGKFRFDGIPDGSYLLIVHASRVDQDAKVGPANISGSALVVLNKDMTSLSISLRADVGAISIKYQGRPVGRYLDADSVAARLRLIDKNGKKVDLVDPARGHIIVSRENLIESIPPGTYTVEILGHGLLPVSKQMVKVEKGKTTEFVLDAEPAAAFTLNICGLKHKLSRISATWQYEAGDGKVVQGCGPNSACATMERAGENGAVAYFHDLHQGVARIRVLLDGYQDIVVDVNCESGIATVKAVEAKLK